jgi:hypothetical protein
MQTLETFLPRLLVAAASGIAACAAPAAEDAPGYPSRSVTIVVGLD